MIKLGFALSARMKFIENNKVSIEVLIVDYISIVASNSSYDKFKNNSNPERSIFNDQIDSKQDEINKNREQNENSNNVSDNHKELKHYTQVSLKYQSTKMTIIKLLIITNIIRTLSIVCMKVRYYLQ